MSLVHPKWSMPHFVGSISNCLYIQTHWRNPMAMYKIGTNPEINQEGGWLRFEVESFI